MSTLKTTNLQHASAASPAIVLASDGTATAQLSSLNGGALSGARNRIINGDMRIDQRNAGASVTATSTANFTYTVDRWAYNVSQASKFTLQKSTVAPSGFSNSLLITSSAATSLGAGDYYGILQVIEGFNTSDLAFGTASANTVTLSFRVRSSLTGTFGGSIQNSAQNRCYPFSYTISSANTWTTISIVVPGDTTGTWNTDNSGGINVYFGLGVGSTYGSGTAGAWTGSTLVVPTGSTSLVGTNGATFYITGVQVESGSTATPFERRSYGQELALCQRYYWKTPDAKSIVFNGNYTPVQFKVSMRAAPTVTITPSGGSVSDINTNTEGFYATASGVTSASAVASIEL